MTWYTVTNPESPTENAQLLSPGAVIARKCCGYG